MGATEITWKPEGEPKGPRPWTYVLIGAGVLLALAVAGAAVGL